MKLSLDVRIGAALVASALLLLPGTARAWQCVADQPRIPEDGATAVPTNAVLLGYGWSSFERLLGPDGEVVPVERRSIPAPYATSTLSGYPVLVPLEELEPETVYTLERDDNSLWWGDVGPAIHPVVFTTGPGPSVAPPPAPVLLAAEPHVGGGFTGVSRYITLDVEHQGLLIGDVGGLGEVTSLDDLLLDPSDSSGEPDTSRRLEWVTSEQTLSIGPSDCGNWPAAAADRQSARFGVLDLAGNFSGWVDIELVLPSREEAEAAAQARQAAGLEKLYGKREGRPPVCTFTPSFSGGIGGAGAWLTLTLTLAGLRRFRRPTR